MSEFKKLNGYDVKDNGARTSIADLQTNKADKSTTLAGYGIADAYTKDEVDTITKYSTDESVIGVWIDGRPLYRKTINVTALPSMATDPQSNVETVSYATNITNMDYPTRMYGVYHDTTKTSGSFNISSAYNFGADRVIDTRLSSNGETLSISTSGSYNFSSYTGYVTIEYVKTTDLT